MVCAVVGFASGSFASILMFAGAALNRVEPAAKDSQANLFGLVAVSLLTFHIILWRFGFLFSSRWPSRMLLHFLLGGMLTFAIFHLFRINILEWPAVQSHLEWIVALLLPARG